MKNEKLNKAKNKVVKFYDDHEALIKFGVVGTAIAGVCISAAIYMTKNSTTVNGKSGFVNGKSGFVNAKGPDDTCVTFGRNNELMVMFDRTKRDEIIENIKNDGCSVTKDGLDILKAVIDNPVIVDR